MTAVTLTTGAGEARHVPRTEAVAVAGLDLALEVLLPRLVELPRDGRAPHRRSYKDAS